MEKLREKWKDKLSLVFFILFPLLLLFFVEFNVTHNLMKVFQFAFDHFMVTVFNILFVFILYGTLCILLKKIWIPTVILSVIFYVISTVEYFKFGTSGTHFVFNDVLMIGYMGDINKFTTLKLTFPLVLNFIFLVLLCVTAIVFRLDISFLKLKIAPWKMKIISCCVVIMMLCSILIPEISKYLYSFFYINNDRTTNTFMQNEKYEDNGFLANFLQSTSEWIDNLVTEPEGYNSKKIESILAKVEDDSSEETNKPNVIFIMCESFGDFRKFENVYEQTKGIYDSYDQVCALEGTYTGEAIVPTFGGYTTRTEFELLSGMPIKSLNDNITPYKYISKDESIAAIPEKYRKLGYVTSYIHPFTAAFYDRDTDYELYGFDYLYFEDSFTEEFFEFQEDRRGEFLKDSCAYQAVEQLLSQREEPQFIYLTTMQNHEPYNMYPNQNEFEEYLSSAKDSCDALLDFVNWVDQFEEETVLVFIGDHFPFFSAEGGVYQMLNIDSENCFIIYEQNYLVHTNMTDVSFSLPEFPISTFYINHIVMEQLSLPLDCTSQYFLSRLPETPIYSSFYKEGSAKDEEMNLLVYDMVVGDRYYEIFER